MSPLSPHNIIIRSAYWIDANLASPNISLLLHSKLCVSIYGKFGYVHEKETNREVEALKTKDKIQLFVSLASSCLLLKSVSCRNSDYSILVKPSGATAVALNPLSSFSSSSSPLPYLQALSPGSLGILSFTIVFDDILSSHWDTSVLFVNQCYT